MKRMMVLIICISMCVCLLPFSAFAAPETIGLYDGIGSSEKMLTVTNPQKRYSTTYSMSYNISGFAEAGSGVYVYVYDSATARYKPYVENGVNLSATVGASGIFIFPVKLSAGRNAFLVRCEKDGAFQNNFFDINVLSVSMFNLRDSLKSIMNQ